MSMSSSEEEYMRSVWEVYIEDWPTTDQPTTHLGKFGKMAISARGHLIHIMFGSTVGFSGSADRMALFPVSWLPSCKIQMAISPWRIVRFTPCFVLGWGFRGRQIEWCFSNWTKFSRYVGENNVWGVIRLVTIWSISCSVINWLSDDEVIGLCCLLTCCLDSGSTDCLTSLEIQHCNCHF